MQVLNLHISKMGQILSIILRFFSCNGGSKAVDHTPKDYHHDQLKEHILPDLQQQPEQSHSIDIIDPQPVSGSITGSYNDTTPYLVLDFNGKDQDHVESVPSDRIIDIVVEEKLYKGVKRIGPYTSTQSILLVGEGDFSFSASLAVAFGSASNIVATSLNTQEFLNTNYGNFPNNKMELMSRGSVILHGVDATKMTKHPRLRKMKFDRIIYNFPHSGFNRESRQSQISRNQKLVSGFLRNAKKMMEEDGELHVTHKSNGFHLEWDIPNLGSEQGLNLIQQVKFKRSKYPGYHTKYGFGGDKDFDCNPSKTYKFALTCK